MSPAAYSPDVIALPDRTIYTVQQTPPSQVRFNITPQKAGVRHVTIWAGGGRQVRFTQIVYP